MNILLLIYAVTTVINLMIVPTIHYYKWKKSKGKRTSIVKASQGILFSFIPVLTFLAAICLLYVTLREEIDKWIDQDPTSPFNIKNPEFLSPPPKKIKKKKKDKPIESRSEILDL